MDREIEFLRNRNRVLTQQRNQLMQAMLTTREHLRGGDVDTALAICESPPVMHPDIPEAEVLETRERIEQGMY